MCLSWIMIDVHQNQSGFHAAILRSVSTSCLDHAMSSSKVSLHSRPSPSTQATLSVARFSLRWVHQELIGSSQTETRPSRAFTSRVHALSSCRIVLCRCQQIHVRARRRCVVCLFHQSSLDWLLFHVSVFACFSAFFTFVRVRSLSFLQRLPLHLKVFFLEWSSCGVLRHGSFWRA